MNETSSTSLETVQAKSDRKTLILPLLIICIGTGWLLTTLGIVPHINWIWTLGLAGIGVLSFAVNGIDKSTVVMGPFFIIASCLSVLRQTGRISLDVEVPILVIVIGCLLLIARSKSIPLPDWMVLEEKQQRS